MMRKLRWALPALTALAVLGTAPAAHAILAVRITDPNAGTTFLVEDNLANDTNNLLGEIAVNATAANAALGPNRAFDVVTLGGSSNALATGTNTGQVSSSGSVQATLAPGQLPIVIAVSDTDFNQPTLNPRILGLTVAGTANNTTSADTVGIQAWNDDANVRFGGTGTPATPGPVFTAGPLNFTLEPDLPGTNLSNYGGATSTPGINETNPYSLTTQLIITTGPSAAGAPRIVNFNDIAVKFGPAGNGGVIPEPGTLALALTGLPLLGIGAWRRRRRAQA